MSRKLGSHSFYSGNPKKTSSKLLSPKPVVHRQLLGMQPFRAGVVLHLPGKKIGLAGQSQVVASGLRGRIWDEGLAFRVSGRL